MLELLLLITLCGYLLARDRKLGPCNPFALYFPIWFIILFAYYLSHNTYIPISSDALTTIFSAKLLSFLIMMIAYLRRPKHATLPPIPTLNHRQQIFLAVALIVLCISLPLVYLKATTIATGYSIFSTAGYIKLRSEITNNAQSFGFLDYFFTLSYIVSSLTMIAYWQKKARISQLILSIFVSLSYCYLTTGRTPIILFFFLLFAPFAIMGFISFKGALVAILSILGPIILISFMTNKGVATHLDFSENISLFLTNLRAYTVAPLVAFLDLAQSQAVPELGENTFRFFVAFLYKIGIIDTMPVPLIKPFSFVPDSTNVYTVYDIYFRDFSFFGMFIPPSFLILHYWLFRKALRFGSVWIFYYCASLYPLSMQFFQDQYFSLLSQWIQICLWYWLFFAL